MRNDDTYFYVLNQHNQRVNPNDSLNPFYGEITINRYRQDKYLSKKRYGFTFKEPGRSTDDEAWSEESAEMSGIPPGGRQRMEQVDDDLVSNIYKS